MKTRALLEQAIAAGACINIDVVDELHDGRRDRSGLGRTSDSEPPCQANLRRARPLPVGPEPVPEGRAYRHRAVDRGEQVGPHARQRLSRSCAKRPRCPRSTLKGIHSHVGRHHSYAEMFRDMVPGLVRWIATRGRGDGLERRAPSTSAAGSPRGATRSSGAAQTSPSRPRRRSTTSRR